MSTMMTFEYLSQLCQNKEQVCSLPAELKDVRGKETHSTYTHDYFYLKYHGLVLFYSTVL